MLFQKFRESIAKKRMVSEISKEKRNVQISHLEEAKTVLVLFNADKTSDYEAISGLTRLLEQGKSKVTSIGYTSGKTVPEVYQMRTSSSVFIQKDLNFFFQPPVDQREFVHSRKFDLVINLDLSSSFPLYYLATVSRANFKIGCGNEQNSCYDLMLDVKQDASVAFFIEQTKNYLNLLKNAS